MFVEVGQLVKVVTTMDVVEIDMAEVDGILGRHKVVVVRAVKIWSIVTIGGKNGSLCRSRIDRDYETFEQSGTVT
jgi:hypothetical protein